MTVVPEKFVPTIAYTGAKVQLRGFDGSMREVDTARVKLRFGEMEWQRDVALVKSKELNDKGILAVNVNDSVLWEILCHTERKKFKSIVVVETGNKVWESEEEEKKAQTIVEQENAGTTELTLVDEEEVDEEEDVEEKEYEDEVLEESLVAGEDVLVKEAEEGDVASGDDEGLHNLPCVKENRERERHFWLK